MQTTSSKQSTNSGDNKGVNVQVVVRSRPLNTREVETKEATVITCSPHTKEIAFTNPKASGGTKIFSFDAVYGPNSTQSELFDHTVRPIVDEVLKGFNCTLFAYGQTGTGKTYTMEGKQDNEAHAGVIPRSIHHIFEALERYTVRVSHMELYNEELRDLLGTENKQLRIYEGLMDVTGKKGCTVNNLEEVIVSNAQSIFSVIENSCRKRQTAETLLNPYSSRSHCIFTITIHTKEATPDGEDLLKVGKLNLVDLAGSENIQRSGAAGERKREAGLINTSLLTLGRVINALTEHSSHVPYRESKLTRLLQDSLGGKTKTCIIATISPAAGCMEETLSTLDYAHRAKNIRNRPEVNQKMTRKALIKEYTVEIEKLKVLLRSARDKNGVYVPSETFDSMEAELAMRRTQVGDVEQILEKRETELEALKTAVGEKAMEIEEKNKAIHSSKEELAKTTEQYNITKDSLLHTQQQLTTHKAYENALRSNLDASLHEREQLFDKIDRKRTVESANKNSVEHAREALLDKVRSLESTLGQAHSTQSVFFSEMEGSLSEFLKRKDEQIQALGKQSDQLALLVTNATKNLDSLAREIQLNSTNALSSISTSVQQQSNVWLDNASQLYQQSMQAVAAMQEMITGQNIEMKLWAGHQINCIRDQNKATSSFLTQQITALRHISEQVGTVAQEQVTRLQGHQSALGSIAASQASSLHAWQDQFILQIGDMIRTEVSRQGHRMKSEVAALASQLDTDMGKRTTKYHHFDFKKDMSKLHHSVLQSVDTSMNDVTQYGTSFKQFVNTVETESSRFIELHDETAVKFNETSDLIGRQSDTYNQKCEQLHRDHAQQVTEKTQQAATSLASLHDTHNSHLADLHVAAADSSCTTIANQVNVFGAAVDHYATLWTNQIGSTSSQAKQMQTEAQSALVNLNKSVTTLFALKEDLPTGVTPIKRPIPVPQLDHFSSPNQRAPSSPTQSTPTRTPILVTHAPLHPQPQPQLQLQLQLDNLPPHPAPKKHAPIASPGNVQPLPGNPLPPTSHPLPTQQQQLNIPAPKNSKIPKMVDKKTLRLSNKENVANAK